MADSPFTTVIFESPHRVVALLHELAEAGLGERQCVVCRELTKLHEEILCGTVVELSRRLEEVRLRGEFTIVVEGGEGTQLASAEAEAEATARAAALADEGVATREIASRLRAEFDLARNEAYRFALRATRTAGPHTSDENGR